MKPTIIFDMDGVIIDSEPIHRQVAKDYFKALDIFMSESEYEQFVGASAKDNLAYVKAKFDFAPSISKMIADLRQIYQQTLVNMESLPMISGTGKLIQQLQVAHYSLILASSANRANINLVLDRFQLTNVFLHKVSGAELPKSKPDPAIFLKAAELQQIAPEKCIVIEDSHHGVTAAKRAGMICIGYKNPDLSNQDLSAADWVVAHMSEVTLEKLEQLY